MAEITQIIKNNELKQNEEHRKETVDLNLNIFDEHILFQIELLPELIRLSDIVPYARKLSSKISNIIRVKLDKKGITVPCRKSCASCCSYLVPLSVPEAFRLREEIFDMPEKYRKTVLDLLLNNARRILEEKHEGINLLEINQLSEWYSNLELQCPFLSDNVCTIYDNRSIACIEHLVTGSELLCIHGQHDYFHKVDLPVSILECLGKLCAELEQTQIEAILLPLALPWAEENINQNVKKWPSLDVIRRFAEIIEESVELSCVAQFR